MYIREKGSPRSNSTSLQICQSYRNDAGQPRSKVLLTLGPKDELLQSGQVTKLISSLAKLAGIQERSDLFKDDILEEIFRSNWGVPYLLTHLWDVFELQNFFKQQKLKIKFDLNQTILNQVVDRFLKPRSKLGFYENQHDYLTSNHKLKLHHLYRSLSALARLKPNLEKHLLDVNRNLFNMKVDIVFFDATTIYFQSDKVDDLRKFGFSKDCKFNDVQIVMGLLMDEDGRPIGFQTFPGNTFDGKTLIKAVTDLKATFAINKLIIVGDRGICSQANIDAIKESGYEYIVGTSLKKQDRKLQEQILDDNGYTSVNKSDLEEFKYKEIQLKDERLIISWSSSRARKDFYDRERLVEKANEILDGKSKLKKPGKAKYLKINEEVQYLDEARIMDDAKWDGYYGIKTNVCKDLKSETEIYDAYKQLWRIEDCFRVLKSHLKIRPVFLWNPEHIEGHLVLCFLTFVFERHLEIELRKKGVETSPTKIRAALEKLQASIVSAGGKEFPSIATISQEASQIFEASGIAVPQRQQIVSLLKQSQKMTCSDHALSSL